MVNKRLWLGMLALALAFGMAVIGCDDGSTGGDGDGGQTLPEVSGVNAVSGKTYYEYQAKIVFSATAGGAASGSYTVGYAVYDYDTDEYVLAKR
jgi:hypothetical protein